MLIYEKHPLFRLHNKKRLALILKTDVNDFKNIEKSFLVYPFRKTVVKKKRQLFNQDAKYKALLKRINRLLCQTNIPNYVYGGIPKKDFLDNALAHHNNRYIQSADIKNFYPSTDESFVYGLFRNKFQTSPDVAKILTLLCTYPNKEGIPRHIPQGFPPSTILSFLAYFDLFNGIYNISKRHDIHFTLFVDDMTFSSNKRIPKSFLKHVSSIVSKYKLELHPDKTRRTSLNKYKIVTGVIIDPINLALKASNSLQKKMYDNFVSIHNYKIDTYKDYIEFKSLVLKLDGQLKSIKRIERDRQTPFIDKVIMDIKDNFIYPGVKGAPYDALIKEFSLFKTFQNAKLIK